MRPSPEREGRGSAVATPGSRDGNCPAFEANSRHLPSLNSPESRPRAAGCRRAAALSAKRGALAEMGCNIDARCRTDAVRHDRRGSARPTRLGATDAARARPAGAVGTLLRKIRLNGVPNARFVNLTCGELPDLLPTGRAARPRPAVQHCCSQCRLWRRRNSVHQTASTL